MVLEIFHLSSAIKICNTARDIGLNVTFSTQTPGEGNCFYHAVVECLKDKSSPLNINHTMAYYITQILGILSLIM